MPQITSIRRRGRGSRLAVYLDGAFICAMEPSAVAYLGLRAGDEIEAERVRSLLATTLDRELSESAWRLLARRPRSRGELRQRLLRRGLPEDAVENRLDGLAAAGHLNDAEFAKSWVAMRQGGALPKGTRALRSELLHKGVEPDVIREALLVSDDTAAARKAAQGRARLLRELDETSFRRRLFAFLQRRGFDVETTKAAVDAALGARRAAALERQDEPR